jgi:HD-GYP domain-containing protein (c-di-GMP phosphodiesterase class II)
VPEPASPAALVALGVGLCFYALLGLRAARTYVLTRRHADLAVAVGIAWLAAAVPPSLLQDYSQLGWWLGHGFELVGIVCVVVPVALDLRRAFQSRPLLGDLRAADLIAAEEAFLGTHVRALMVRLADKDEYTEGHTRRVALRAVQIGEELGFPRGRLRTLAIGGWLHDIGKLAVPDSILKKPAPLDERERGVVLKHPQWGVGILCELGGFSEGVHRLVLDHHERLDGAGYPRGLREAQLDLDTRILSVCDVYDALISSRVYRPAWSHADAIAHLRANVGTVFDRRCVEALERVLEAEIDRGRELLADSAPAFAGLETEHPHRRARSAPASD